MSPDCQRDPSIMSTSSDDDDDVDDGAVSTATGHNLKLLLKSPPFSGRLGSSVGTKYSPVEARSD